MKRIGFLAVALVFLSCNNEAEVKTKIDSLGKELDTGLNKAWDSTKAGAKRLKDKIEDKLDKDSTDKN